MQRSQGRGTNNNLHIEHALLSHTLKFQMAYRQESARLIRIRNRCAFEDISNMPVI